MNKQDINLKEWELEFKQRDRQSVLMADFWSRSIFLNLKKELKLDVGNQDSLFASPNNGYAKIKQKEKIVEKLKEAVQDLEYVDYLLKGTIERVKELEDFSSRFENLKSDVGIVDLIKEFDEIMCKVVVWFYIPWYVTEFNLITDLIKAKLKGVEKITDINNALAVVCFPVKKAIFQEEQKDFYELCKKYSDDKARDYLRKYAWMKTYVTLPIEPLSLPELKKRIEEAKKEGFVSQYETQEKQKEKNQELADKILKVLNKKTRILVGQAREIAFVLTSSVERAIKAWSKLIPMYKIIAKELGIDYGLWNNLTVQEIIGGLQGKKIPDKIKERDDYVFLMENGKQEVVYGKEARAMLKWVGKIGEVDENIKEFKGQPAHSGNVKGKARICLTPKESYDLKEGEILVCSMTSPDYVPAMKKASAIITDEGGMLSHASIISRELGKVCVVGTKVATQVLKDGMIVEVDADNGIVRIIG